MSCDIVVEILPVLPLQLILTATAIPALTLLPTALPTALDVDAVDMSALTISSVLPLQLTLVEHCPPSPEETNVYAAITSGYVYRGGYRGVVTDWYVDRWPRPAASGPSQRATQTENPSYLLLDSAWPIRLTLTYI